MACWPIETDVLLNVDALWRFHALAEEHGLSAYDAACLELTQRRAWTSPRLTENSSGPPGGPESRLSRHDSYQGDLFAPARIEG
jgi:hypothetical protein